LDTETLGAEKLSAGKLSTVKVEISPSVTIGDGQKLLIIAGPCQIESRDHACTIAEFLVSKFKNLPVSLVFKSSFDKANRTSVKGQRGIGMDAGLKILEEIKKTFNVPVLTDIHTEDQCDTVASVVDVLQIPAFLCRQTDLLVAAGKTGKTIHVKKGQFLHPADMQFVAEKIASTGNSKVLLCERGSCFGYRDLVVDPRNFIIMRSTGYPVVFDATHSVQQLGGSAGSSGGARHFVQALARAAVATGVDGVFVECHNDPDNAPSDGPCMLQLDQVVPLVSQLCKLREALS
jgi:2-dehydro-3-deoxyphosphooctonate aldolase (KDO 8-P synthase)